MWIARPLLAPRPAACYTIPIMPDLRRELWIATRPLPEGLWLAEVLHLPEVSHTGVLRRQVHRELYWRKVEDKLKEQ